MKRDPRFRPVGMGWWVDPRICSVRVNDLRAYLLRKGWRLRTQPREEVLFFEREGPAGATDVQTVPAREDSSDYLQRVIEVLTGVAALEQRYAVEVLDEVLHPTNSEVNGPAGDLPSSSRARALRPQ